MKSRRIAPWLDYAGNQIHEGDIIKHPSGHTGRVIFLAEEWLEVDRWR